MSSKYYAHFVADSPELRQAGEFTGDLKAALARNFDLVREDIRILHWSRLH